MKGAENIQGTFLRSLPQTNYIAFAIFSLVRKFYLHFLCHDNIRNVLFVSDNIGNCLFVSISQIFKLNGGGICLEKLLFLPVLSYIGFRLFVEGNKGSDTTCKPVHV